jgi:multidrug resistance efflux pump
VSNFDYDHWWSLHLRVAKGENLSTQEQRDYELGLGQLDSQSESSESDTIAYLRSLRAAINRALNLHAELTARSAELDRKIVALESNYQRITGHSLSLEPHAPA